MNIDKMFQGSTLGKLILLSSLLAAGTSTSGAAAECGFPGQSSTCESPNRRYKLVNEDYPSSLHVLRLRNTDEPRMLPKENVASKRRPPFLMLSEKQIFQLQLESEKKVAWCGEPIYAFGGAAVVLWCPNSKYFVVNDKFGSNLTFVELFKSSDPRSPLNLGEKLESYLSSSKNLRSLLDADHLYFRVTKWINSNTLELVVAGHGDQTKAFMLVFHYTVDGKIQFVKRSKSGTF